MLVRLRRGRRRSEKANTTREVRKSGDPLIALFQCVHDGRDIMLHHSLVSARIARAESIGVERCRQSSRPVSRVICLVTFGLSVLSMKMAFTPSFLMSIDQLGNVPVRRLGLSAHAFDRVEIENPYSRAKY